MHRIFIGFDPRQVVSYTALCTSIIRHADAPVSITPLIIETLPLKRPGLTPFTWSRFLVPWLCGFEGHALFLDIDTMLRADVSRLFAICRTGKEAEAAVLVSKNKLKFEWASVMMFNCAHPDNARLTPQFVETAEKLHGISWTDQIGAFPGEWNHLVGYDEPNPNAKLVHFTQGVPAWPETADCEFAAEWRAEAEISLSAQSWASLMSMSVHAKPVYERLKAAGRILPGGEAA